MSSLCGMHWSVDAMTIEREAYSSDHNTYSRRSRTVKSWRGTLSEDSPRPNRKEAYQSPEKHFEVIENVGRNSEKAGQSNNKEG